MQGGSAVQQGLPEHVAHAFISLPPVILLAARYLTNAVLLYMRVLILRLFLQHHTKRRLGLPMLATSQRTAQGTQKSRGLREHEGKPRLASVSLAIF